MKKQGFLPIKREIQDHWIWKVAEPFDKRSAWIDLIMMANYQDSKLVINNDLVDVPRGSRITSIKQLSEKWLWSRTKVKNFLELLQKDNMIEFKSTQKKTYYTIVNYKAHQDIEDIKKATERQLKDIKSATERHQKDTKEQYNNINKINKNNNIYIGSARNGAEDVRENDLAFEENDSTRENDLALPNGFVLRVRAFWNTLSKNIEKISDINPRTPRYEALSYLFKNFGKDQILVALDNVSKSAFLLGDVSDFEITFEWFLDPKNFRKILSGKYQQNYSKQNKSEKQNLYLADNRISEEERQVFVNSRINRPLQPKKRRHNESN